LDISTLKIEPVTVNSPILSNYEAHYSVEQTTNEVIGQRLAASTSWFGCTEVQILSRETSIAVSDIFAENTLRREEELSSNVIVS